MWDHPRVFEAEEQSAGMTVYNLVDTSDLEKRLTARCSGCMAPVSTDDLDWSW